MLAGAPPQTPLGELTALPGPLTGFKEPILKTGRGEGKGRKVRGGEGR